MMRTPSQDKAMKFIEKSIHHPDSGWEIKRIDAVDGRLYVVFEINKDCVFLHETIMMVIGPRGRKEIISASVFSTCEKADRIELEKTAASLFCFDIYGYGKHPKIKIKKY